MARLNKTRIFYHILFWMCYLPLNASLSCVIQNANIFEDLQAFLLGEATTLFAKLFLVYYLFYFIIPRYLDRRNPIILLLQIILGFMMAIAIYRLVDVYFYYGLILHVDGGAVFTPVNVALSTFDLFVTASAALTIKMVRVGYSQLEHEQELIREKLSSELDFLRAQTNPHFLFNTLNNLYGLARKKSDKAPQGIMMLSKIMRFMLYDCKAHRIPLSSEAKVIQDYIELEKLRYNDRLRVNYEQDFDNSSAMIAPLLLLPFVENSFKHGAHSSTGDAEINIRLFLKNNQLDFAVENTFEEEQMVTSNDPDASGIGMRNERRQLDLLYPDRHSLDIDDSSGWYRAYLKIDLNDRDL
jgi:two-component system, LytTR family, sensor kinase